MVVKTMTLCKEYVMRTVQKSYFGIGPNPGDLRIRYILLAPVVVYVVFLLATVAMVMAGAPMKADPILHAPITWIFNH
jgi:hypothetical protein